MVALEGWRRAMAIERQINLVDPDIYQRSGAPHEQFAWLREHAPVFWHAEGGGAGWPGFWAVTKHEDVAQVTRHPEIFSSARRTAVFKEWPDMAVERMRLMMINMDPPQHTRQRAFVNRGFTPRIIGKLEEHITQVCHGLLDDIAGDSEADFVTQIAAPLPTQVICELVGAPAEDRGRIFMWSNRAVGFDDVEMAASPAEQMQAVREMYAYAGELADSRRKQPRDDIVTQLLEPDDTGQELTTLEFNFFFLLLTVAGNETTRNAAAGGMLAFFDHPEQWQRLVDDPALAASAAEEIVRWVSPANLVRRTAIRDAELSGQRIAEGDKVVAFLTSGNRDEDVFAAPQEFDIGRDPNPHVGFSGGGPHYCLGRHLAALELRVMLTALAERMPGIALDGEVSRLRSNFVNGFKHMPVRLPAAGR
ncbi:MAG TPA: cytochrome P450 [Streptosporangiaceae bacterium]|nr:cytochrome P450 [Streptosporangiaceae bacterium]